MTDIYYYNKYIKYKNKYLKLVSQKQSGGVGEEKEEEMHKIIDLRQILITQPIIDAVKGVNADINLDDFSISKGEQGFRLNRVNEIRNIKDFENFVNQNPILVKKLKGVGKKIDGNLVQLYEIIDGRHRFARSIIDGLNNIRVKVIL